MCEDRQCQEPEIPWEREVWIISPEADWNASYCPKPSAIADREVAYWFEMYRIFRDRGLAPDAGGYNDQSAKLMEIFAIMSAWQTQYEAAQREKALRENRHNKLKGSR